MTNEPTHDESAMLEEVRRWRAEAFEADRIRTPTQRERDRAELLKRFGLEAPRKDHPRDRDIKNERDRA